MPKNGSPSRRCDDLVQRAAGLADPQRPVPLRDRLEVRARPAARRSRGSPRGSSAASSTTNPARQFSAPQMPNATVNRSPRSIRRSLGLSRPKVARSPLVSIRWQERGVPFHPSSATASSFAHPRPQPEEQPADAVRGLARGVFEGRELLDLVDHAQAVGGVDQQVAGVLDRRRDGVSRRSSSTMYAGTSIVPRSAYVLPADHARPGSPASTPSSARISRERPGAVARLARQAEVLEQVPPHRQRRRPGHAEALVADQDAPARPTGRRSSIASSKRGSKPVRYARLALCSRSA